MKNFSFYFKLRVQSFSTKHFVVFMKLKKSPNEAQPQEEQNQGMVRVPSVLSLIPFPVADSSFPLALDLASELLQNVETRMSKVR